MPASPPIVAAGTSGELLNAAEIGAPKTLAWAACSTSSLGQPELRREERLAVALKCGLNSFITENSAKKIGSWSSIGMQPETGLVPCSL